MSCEDTELHGAPYLRVDAKRSWDNEQIGIDWHDYLIKKRVPGKSVALNEVFRPLRSQATGMQYRCTIAGVLSGAQFQDLRWPRASSATIVDGAATWVAEAVSPSSLISTVQSSSWVSPVGITPGAESSDDLRYMLFVEGGASGEDYLFKNRLTLVNGQKKEGVIVLPVRD